MALTTDDLVEINHLYAKYSHALDGGLTELFLSVWAPDGTFTQEGRTRRGHEELRVMGSRDPSEVGRHRHFISNIMIDGDGDQATGACYLYLTRDVKQEPLIGIYSDTLVKLDGRWVFKTREVKGDPNRRVSEKYREQQAAWKAAGLPV